MRNFAIIGAAAAFVAFSAVQAFAIPDTDQILKTGKYATDQSNASAPVAEGRAAYESVPDYFSVIMRPHRGH